MKHLSYLYIFSVIVILGSCERVNDVTDITPPYKLSADVVITDISSAERVLNGAYAQMRKLESMAYPQGLAGSMGLSYSPGTSNFPEFQQFYDNSVSSDNAYIRYIYTNYYFLINMSSFVREKTAKLTTTEPRKEIIMGESSFLRAFAHFSLLRLYGRFYDVNSEYGIVTWNQPVSSLEAKPRSTVKESYDQILADLDYAIAHTTDYSTPVYVSRQAAMMLKAKVLLYMKEYTRAAAAAAEAIQQKGAVKIEPVFDDIFKKANSSKEVILAIPLLPGYEGNNKTYMMRSNVAPTMYYFNFMNGDTRKNSTVFLSGTVYVCGKFQPPTGFTGTISNEYYLRLAELYLIQAEALIRSSSGTAQFQAARDAINVVRGRANMPLIANTVNTKPELLTALRREKQLELGCESGEEWFDLVRFGSEGDLKVSDFKPNVKSEIQYIIPIPNESIVAGKNVVSQNPGF